MGAGAALWAQAQHLRQAAKQMRDQASTLGDGIADVQKHYPAGTGSVWEGPAADKFFGELTTARSQLDSVDLSVESYATACEARAGQLEKRAAELDAQPASH